MSGKVKHKNGETSYSIILKAEKLSVKMAGIVGSELTTTKYRGPRGKVNLVDLPVPLTLSAQPALTVLSVFPVLGEKGSISGSATILSGYNNDFGGQASFLGKYKISEKKSTLSFKMASGKQKVSFKGKLNGDGFEDVIY